MPCRPQVEPCAHIDDWGTYFTLPTITVVEQEPIGPVKTGLLDAYGRPLYRVPSRAPMGFWTGPPAGAAPARRRP